jgi:hypothetical protein
VLQTVELSQPIGNLVPTGDVWLTIRLAFRPPSAIERLAHGGPSDMSNVLSEELAAEPRIPNRRALSVTAIISAERQKARSA